MEENRVFMARKKTAAVSRENLVRLGDERSLLAECER
jgi:hypothetical protein